MLFFRAQKRRGLPSPYRQLFAFDELDGLNNHNYKFVLFNPYGTDAVPYEMWGYPNDVKMSRSDTNAVGISMVDDGWQCPLGGRPVAAIDIGAIETV